MSNKAWGNATWILFHTLAQQIKEDEFIKEKSRLINFVKRTCTHLPCPKCAADATRIVSRAYVDRIETKDDFIEFLRQFHNIVNTKLQKPALSAEEVELKYKRAKIHLVIQNFFSILSVSYGNMKMLIHSYQRQQFIRSQQEYLNNLLTKCIILY
jgi:hypothetical protein